MARTAPILTLLLPLALGLSACGEAGNGSGAEDAGGNEIADTGSYDNRATTGYVGTVDQVEPHAGTSNAAATEMNGM